MNNNKFFKITIIGSSVSLRIRPREHETETNFGQKLEQKINNELNVNCLVTNLGFGRATSKEAVLKLDTYISSFPDLFVINLGAVDAPNREIPLWYSDILYKRRRSMFSWFLMRFYNGIIKDRRPLFSKLRKASWVSQNNFVRDIRFIVSKLKKDTNAKIIIMGINSGNSRIESILPGTNQKYKAYSDELNAIAEEHTLPFLNVADLNAIEHFPDGVHYNEAGHQIVCNRLFEIVINQLFPTK